MYFFSGTAVTEDDLLKTLLTFVASLFVEEVLNGFSLSSRGESKEKTCCLLGSQFDVGEDAVNSEEPADSDSSENSVSLVRSALRVFSEKR